MKADLPKRPLEIRFPAAKAWETGPIEALFRRKFIGEEKDDSHNSMESDSKPQNHGKNWSDQEETELRKKYPTTSSTTLASELGRTTEAIKTRAKKLGLSKVKEDDPQENGPDKEAIKRGLEAEDQFEEFVESQGWTWYRNGTFRNYWSNKTKYQNQIKFKKSILEDPDEDWISDEKLQEEIAEVREKLEPLRQIPTWFVDLRKEVDQALEDREPNWTAYPDYVVGDHPEEPRFVEVKYGSSNLSANQHEFFEFLLENGFPVFVFRVTASGEYDLSEWNGGWR